MSQFFNTILYQPLFNLLVFFYNIIPGHDVGVAILIIAFLIKAVLYPLTKTTLRTQRKMTELAPQIKEIQEKHKNDKTKKTEETMKLYQEHGVNPLGGCLPLLIQLPLLIALFQVFRTGFDSASLTNLYSFIENPGELNPWFLGFVDLSSKNIFLAILAGGAQFFHTRIIGGGKTRETMSSDISHIMQKQMIFMAPVLTTLVSFSLPAALPFYWLANTILSIGEHYLPKNTKPKIQSPKV